MKLEELFGGEDAIQYNVLMTALRECAKDGEQPIYTWLESTPKTSLIALLVDKIKELGYEIKLK